MSECLPNLPRYIRQLPDGSWLGAPGKHGPWRSIPASQQALPCPTDGPAVPEGREPASVAPEATGQLRPLSPAAQAVFDAWIYPARFPVDKAGKGAKTALAQALRAVADQVVPQGGPFLMTASEDRVRHQLLAIAAELEGAND